MSIALHTQDHNEPDASPEVTWQHLATQFPVGDKAIVEEFHEALCAKGSFEHNYVRTSVHSAVFEFPLHTIPVSFDFPNAEKPEMRVHSKHVLTCNDEGTYYIAEIQNEFQSKRSGAYLRRYERAVFQGEDKGFYTVFEVTFQDEQGKDIVVLVNQSNQPNIGVVQSLEIRHGDSVHNVDLNEECFRAKSKLRMSFSEQAYDINGQPNGIKQHDLSEMGMKKIDQQTVISFDPLEGVLHLFIEGKYSLNLKLAVPQLKKRSLPHGPSFFTTLYNHGAFPMFVSMFADIGMYQEIAGRTDAARFLLLGAPIGINRDN